MRLLVVGLGNPGKPYAMTRHNLGFLVVEAFAKSMGWSFREERRYPGVVAKGKAGGCDLHLLLPLTYMNESGVAVRKYVDYFALEPGHILVVADDVALPFGRMRMRPSGGAGGHNGLKSINAHLGTDGYARLRMGIGDRKNGTLTNHVLGRFAEEEKEQLAQFVGQGADVVGLWLREDVEAVMKKVNSQKQCSGTNNNDTENIPPKGIGE